MRKLAAVAALALGLACGGGAAQAADYELSLAGAGPSSLAYNLAAGVAENTNTKTKKLRITAETSSGFVENIRLVGRGETELALTGGPDVFNALRGEGQYKGEPPYTDIRGLAVNYTSAISWNAREGITKIEDLVGKTVSVGPPGSALTSMGELILDAYGIKDKVKILRLSFDESARAYVDGTVDAFVGGPPPYPAVMQAGAQKKITILSVGMEYIRKMQASAPVVPFTIPAKSYDWMDKEALTVGFLGYLIANKSVPDEAVYELLKVNLSPAGVEYLKANHKVWRIWETPQYITRDGAFSNEGLKLHPGAVRYWKEQGVALPAALLP